MASRQSFATPHSPPIAHGSSRETACDAPQTHHDTLIHNEIANWLMSLECNGSWIHKGYECCKTLPTANQLLTELKSSESNSTSLLLDPIMFDTLVTMIVLQLLAACPTCLPLHQERTKKQLVSALESHTLHRFAPAAGHHARAPSETASWPDLCAFEAPKPTSSERRIHTRKQLSGSENTPTFSGSGWTNGPTPDFSYEEDSREQRHGEGSPLIDPQVTDFATEGSKSPTNGRNVHFDNVSNSTSEEEPTFFSRLMCQLSASKNAKHKQNGQVQRRMQKNSPGRNMPSTRRQYSNRLQQLTSQAAQRIPSSIRLRRTQSVPRHAAQKAEQVAEATKPRRRSSNPSIGSPLSYPYEIPQIHRISATPAASNNQYASTNGSLRGSERSELSPTPENLEESRRHQVELWQSKALFPPRQMKNTPPPSIRSPASSIETRRHTLPAAYLKSTYPDEHAFDKNDPNTAEKGNTEAGPDISSCPRLQRVLSNMSHDEDEDSSDSELERTRKRKSIMIRDSPESSAIAEMFGRSSGESGRR
ncbi:hypothetical protein T440DRAFT_479324 [Plenodomus tracheiphilus IPT5]|uniref:Uncharacterized protein n=1 Tax=Plenodomus tracheiphilus IPT5 TaxID=1408161 RepID=A0A6A7B4T6_9PLEO|nr:hypothetical protein T440DRAFT_479324 [Plenodomus tracheiphilus IPT5]